MEGNTLAACCPTQWHPQRCDAVCAGRAKRTRPAAAESGLASSGRGPPTADSAMGCSSQLCRERQMRRSLEAACAETVADAYPGDASCPQQPFVAKPSFLHPGRRHPEAAPPSPPTNVGLQTCRPRPPCRPSDSVCSRFPGRRENGKQGKNQQTTVDTLPECERTRAKPKPTSSSSSCSPPELKRLLSPASSLLRSSLSRRSCLRFRRLCCCASFRFSRSAAACASLILCSGEMVRVNAVASASATALWPS